MRAARIVAVLVLAGSAVAGDKVPAFASAPSAFRFMKPVERDKTPDETIVGITLDSDIYAATRDDLPDLRILDDTGAEVSYQIEPLTEARTERVRHGDPVKITALDEHDGSIEVQVQLPRDAPAAEGLTIVTPLRDFVRKVQAFGSVDGQDWTRLVSDGVIYDYSRFADVNQHEIVLPANSFRRFKLVIADVTDEQEFPYKELTRTLHGDDEAQRVVRTMVERRPLRIDRILAWHHTVAPREARPVTTDYPIESFQVEQDAKQQQTIVEVHTRRQPITSFTLQSATHNFHRQASVDIPATRHDRRTGEVRPSQSWSPIAHAALFNFEFRNERREQLTIHLPEQRQETYRIVIENQDNPPLEITGVRAAGPQYRAVFLARAEKPYRVAYGSQSAAAPRYDAAAVLPHLRQENPVVAARLGDQVQNTGYGGEPSAGIGALFDNWYFLGTAIVVMVAVLGWGLFRAGQRLENLPPESR